VHRPWIRQVRPRLAAAGLDRGWLAELIPPSGFWPYFLNPAPDGPAPPLSAELAAIQDAPVDRVRHDLDHLEYHQGGLGPHAGAAFNDLHAAVRWDGGAPHLVRRSRPLSRTAAGPGLLLVPSAFTGPRLLTRVAPPEPPQLATRRAASARSGPRRPPPAPTPSPSCSAARGPGC
jgi:hypothetical protein